MKTAFFSAIIILSISFSANASHTYNNEQLNARYTKVDSTSPLSQWLSLYYDLKNALVNSDATAAATKAGALLSAIDKTDTKTLSAADQKTLTALVPKLTFDARHISEVKDINHQREHFASLSLNMAALAKATKLSTQPIYKEYCPMKKAYWLSNESAIQNPYFGNQMLTCGQVTETIK
jgi:hypothetical protein